jgi:lysozyme
MSDMSLNNPALDTQVTKINPKGRGGWVAVTVMLLVGFEGLTNIHGGNSVGTHQSFDPRGINTVCYGHIENVHIGDTYTKLQCQKMLANDLPRYEAMVERCIKVPMPGYRHAAILSFTYNIGGGVPAKNGHPAHGGLCGSSVARYINAGQPEKGCDALLLYDKAVGKVLPGLVRRRQAERKMCYNSNEPPLPNEEVLAEGRRTGEGNVDQETAVKEAKAIKLPPVVAPVTPPKVAPAPEKPMKGITVTPAPVTPPKVAPAPAPAPAPVALPWYSRLGHWFMEK